MSSDSAIVAKMNADVKAIRECESKRPRDDDDDDKDDGEAVAKMNADVKAIRECESKRPRDDDDDDKDDGEADGNKDTKELTYLLNQAREYHAPGLHVVAVGPSTVVSMVTLGRATQQAVSDNARGYAATQASCGNRGYAELTSDEEKRKWVQQLELSVDCFNRGIDSGAFLNGAITVFNGMRGIKYSSQTTKKNANFPSRSNFGRCVKVHHVVNGYVSMADQFAKGNTNDLLVDAWRLADNIIAIDESRDAESLFPVLNTWKCVAIDCRKSVLPGNGSHPNKRMKLAEARDTEDELPEPVISEAECNVCIVPKTA